MGEPENPPAFPLGVPHMTEYQPEWGMSLRDWFAGQAMIGMAGYLINEDDACAEAARIAAHAFVLADAMLAERLK